MRKNDISLYANCSTSQLGEMCKRASENDGPYLLPKADPRSSVERQENERIADEVFVKTFVKESVRVEEES